MATTNLAMTLPTVGASTNVWGGILNTDLSIIDGVFNTAGNGTSVGLNIGSGKTLSVTGSLVATGAVTLPAATSITNATFNILTIIGNGTTVTLTFNQAAIIVTGTTITISGVSPSGFNGTYTSTTSSSGSVSYLSSQTGSGTGGTIYYPLAIATTSGSQTLTGKTLQDPSITGTITGTYSIAGTPTLTSALTSSADVTFKKNDPILTFNNLAASFGYRLWANIDTADSGFYFQQFSSSAWNTALTIASDRGLFLGGATGGSKGVGTINATAYYVNGSLQPISASYASDGTDKMTVNTTITLTHGLGSVPEIVMFTLTCSDSAGDAGYSQNDKIMIPLNNGQTYSSASYGYSTQVSATQIIIRVVNGAGPLVIVNKSTKALAGLNESKWTLLVQAYV